MNVFHLKPNYLHLLNIPCFYKSLPYAFCLECLFLPNLSYTPIHFLPGELLLILQDQGQMSFPLCYLPRFPWSKFIWAYTELCSYPYYHAHVIVLQSLECLFLCQFLPPYSECLQGNGWFIYPQTCRNIVMAYIRHLIGKEEVLLQVQRLIPVSQKW